MIFLLPLDHGLFQNKEDNLIETEKKDLKSSDIAGSDLYAESINAFVVGNKSIIKQSLFTNDTNILSQFDSNDPAFSKCNIIISASNGVNPEIFPTILTESEIPSQYIMGFNNFVGFLYYDKDLDTEDAKSRAERALEIIRQKFKIDLIMVNVSEPNLFPFVGHPPNWDCFFQELTTNFPMDGYWKTMDLNRLTSQMYLEDHHISSTFMLLNSLDFFEGDYDLSTDQVNFNIDSIDLSFIENLEMENIIDQFDALTENYGDLINVTISEDEFEQFTDIFGSFTLKNDTHYTSISIQYEGLDEGIQEVGTNQYKFNLWKALGYEGEPLAPSEKIYIALVGAFMSEIEISILCTDIIDATPINFEFYDYLLEQIALIFYLAGTEFDVQELEDYSFELFWVNDGGIKHSYVKPVNLNNPSDIVNMLQYLGFQGFSSIPTGIVNPFNELSVTYNVSDTEPNLYIKKELIEGNASYGAFRNFSYYISAENVGEITAWGIPTPIPIELNDYFLLLTLGNQDIADEFQDTLWEVVRIEYPNQYESLEDFFNFDEDPRIFYFDTFGTGIYDTFFPNMLNLTNLSPYNEDIDNVIDIIVTGYPQLISALAILGLTPGELKDIFSNKYSIYNDNNWKLEPGEMLSYQINNYSIANLDSFSPFYLNNFTIESTPKTPEIIYGTQLAGTSPEMALSTDNENWIIGSIEQFLEQRIELEFIFKNNTNIDFTNNTLERASIIINITSPDNLDSLDFEIFDFDAEEFRDMSLYLESIINNTWTFSFVNNNESLNWLFYPLDNINYTVLFKIMCIDSEQFNISINDLDIEFSTRDINFNNDSGSRVLYASSTSYVQFEKRSNSIPLNTFNAASIIAYSYLAKNYSNPGELNTYTINFKNIGSNIAENLSISLLIPGIMNEINNFTLQDSNLSYYLDKLAPFEEKTLNFTFYVPNSISISKTSIVYYNPEKIQGGNSSKIVSFTNEVYVSAPVDYKEYSPFIRTIEIYYNNSNSNPINEAPGIGDIFNLTVNLKNIGPIGFQIPDISVIMNDQFGDLRRFNDELLYFENITYNERIAFNITLQKIGWKGYFYPSINFIESSESRTIQISNSAFKILGEINFSIVKSVNKDQIEIGDVVIVNIEVENTGTIAINNFRVNDMISYSQSDFSLLTGKLVNLIISLEPNEKISINYTLKSKRQALVSLKSASIKFYYLLENKESSNIVTIKIITPKTRQLYYICLPILIVFVISTVYIWQSKKYKKKKSEFERSEMEIFQLSSRETIFKIDHTLRERLSIISRKDIEYNFDINKDKSTDKFENIKE